MDFNDRLKILRKELGLTQRELAKNIGVGRTTISEYENGNIKPTQDGLIKMAELLGVSVDYLTGVSDDRIPVISDNTLKKVTHIDHFIVASMSKIKYSNKNDGEVVFKNRILNEKQLKLMYEQVRCAFIMCDEISKMDF